MSTNEVQNVDTAVKLAAATFTLMDMSKWSVVESDVIDEKGSRETLLQRNDADLDYPETIRVGYYPNGKTGDEEAYSCSLRHVFWNKHTDDNSEIHYEQDSIVIAFNTKRQPLLEVAASMPGKLMNTVSMFMGNTSTGAPDWDGLARLTRGITDFNVGDLTRT